MWMLWVVGYELFGLDDSVCFIICNDQFWMSVVEGVIDVVFFIGDFVVMGFDYFVNFIYMVSDLGGQFIYCVYKKCSFFLCCFVIEELCFGLVENDELVLFGLI